MSAAQIAWLVAAILIVNAGFWVAVIIWARRGSAALADSIGQAAARHGEELVLGPESALYRGGTEGRGRLKGNCIIGLTSRRLMYSLLIGGPGEIQLADIESVSESKSFLNAYRNGRMHMILHLRDGSQVGFIVKNHDAWMSAVRPAISGSGGLEDPDPARRGSFDRAG